MKKFVTVEQMNRLNALGFREWLAANGDAVYTKRVIPFREEGIVDEKFQMPELGTPYSTGLVDVYLKHKWGIIFEVRGQKSYRDPNKYEYYLKIFNTDYRILKFVDDVHDISEVKNALLNDSLDLIEGNVKPMNKMILDSTEEFPSWFE